MDPLSNPSNPPIGNSAAEGAPPVPTPQPLPIQDAATQAAIKATAQEALKQLAEAEKAAAARQAQNEKQKKDGEGSLEGVVQGVSNAAASVLPQGSAAPEPTPQPLAQDKEGKEKAAEKRPVQDKEGKEKAAEKRPVQDKEGKEKAAEPVLERPEMREQGPAEPKLSCGSRVITWMTNGLLCIISPFTWTIRQVHNLYFFIARTFDDFDCNCMDICDAMSDSNGYGSPPPPPLLKDELAKIRAAIGENQQKRKEYGQGINELEGKLKGLLGNNRDIRSNFLAVQALVEKTTGLAKEINEGKLRIANKIQNCKKEIDELKRGLLASEKVIKDTDASKQVVAALSEVVAALSEAEQKGQLACIDASLKKEQATKQAIETRLSGLDQNAFVPCEKELAAMENVDEEKPSSRFGAFKHQNLQQVYAMMEEIQASLLKVVHSNQKASQDNLKDYRLYLALVHEFPLETEEAAAKGKEVKEAAANKRAQEIRAKLKGTHDQLMSDAHRVFSQAIADQGLRNLGNTCWMNSGLQGLIVFENEIMKGQPLPLQRQEQEACFESRKRLHEKLKNFILARYEGEEATNCAVKALWEEFKVAKDLPEGIKKQIELNRQLDPLDLLNVLLHTFGGGFFYGTETSGIAEGERKYSGVRMEPMAVLQVRLGEQRHGKFNFQGELRKQIITKLDGYKVDGKLAIDALQRGFINRSADFNNRATPDTLVFEFPRKDQADHIEYRPSSELRAKEQRLVKIAHDRLFVEQKHRKEGKEEKEKFGSLEITAKQKQLMEQYLAKMMGAVIAADPEVLAKEKEVKDKEAARGKGKNQTSVMFPEDGVVDFGEFIGRPEPIAAESKEKKEQDAKIRLSERYQIQAFTHHEGSDQGGHWTTVRLCADGKWRSFSDSDVEEISDSKRKKLLEQCCHVFLRRVVEQEKKGG